MLIILTQTGNYSSRQMLIKYRKRSQTITAPGVPPFGGRIINPSTPSSHSARVLPIRSQFVSPNRLTCKTSHLAEELLEEVREIAGKDDISKDLLCTTTTRLGSSPDTWGQDMTLELLTRNWYWPLMDSFVQMKDTDPINMFVDDSTRKERV